MTNEEAKEVFLNRGFVNGLFDGDKWRQSIVVISKWLEQEPNIDMHSEEIKILQKRSYLEGFHEALKMSVEQEPCEDCISRQEALKCFTWTNTKDDVYYGIKALSSIQPTTKENLVVEDCISRQAVLSYIERILNQGTGKKKSFEFIRKFVESLPGIQPKPKTECSCEQIKWERDIAIEQLHELGYELGQKIEPCEDCISRKAVLDALNKWDWQELYLPVHFKDIIDDLPSIRSKTDVLDKIRAEIIENSIEDYKYHGCGTDELIIETSEVLKIIDKYTAEKE